MASQVAHIIYCHKYFEKYPSKINKDEFMLGSVFPDVLRIDKKLSRKDTHACFSDIDLNFTGLNDFQAGWKFHLYCDMRREEILEKQNFYLLKKTTDFWHLPAKMLEDELVYEQYNNCEKIVNYFNNVNYTNHLVSRETASLWYAINAKYFEKKPNSRSISIFLSKLPDWSGLADEVVDVIDELRKNKQVTKILKNVYKDIV